MRESGRDALGPKRPKNASLGNPIVPEDSPVYFALQWAWRARAHSSGFQLVSLFVALRSISANTGKPVARLTAPRTTQAIERVDNPTATSVANHVPLGPWNISQCTSIPPVRHPRRTAAVSLRPKRARGHPEIAPRSERKLCHPHAEWQLTLAKRAGRGRHASGSGYAIHLAAPF
jgi:hypothetical protein